MSIVFEGATSKRSIIKNNTRCGFDYLKSSAMSEHDAGVDTKRIFSVGDLIWVKLGKYPFWPCMVSFDPIQGDCIRLDKAKNERIYHVQFFGEAPQRGWTVAGNIFEFKGESAYFERTQDLLVANASRGTKFLRKLKAKYSIPASSRKKWLIAVEEAEEAAKIINLGERFRSYVFDYEKLKSKKSSKGAKGKQKSSVSSDYRVKLRNSISSGEGINLRSSVLNVTETRAKQKRNSASADITVKQKRTVVTGKKAKRKSSNLYGTSNGTCLDKSAHCSKRIRLSDDSSQVCDVCDKENVDLTCSGICGTFFHMECLGITNIPENFKCAKCSSGLFSCFACKMTSGTLKECANSKCTKYYHAKCLEQYECANKDKNICPLHTCLTCYRENSKNIMSHKGNMVQCMHCPTAFHSRESCIAAGSVVQSSSSIICSLHFDETHKHFGLKTSNANYCAMCYSGGELVCCETCPNAFHEDCLQSDIPNEDFICDDCRNRRYLFYNMVVFGKTGKFSWWPGQIIHETHLSDAVKKAKKCDGQFAVYFFGTHNYSWLHGGRVYPYEEQHQKMKLKSKDQKFKLGLEEAVVAFEEYQKNRLTDSYLHKRPEAYRHIQVNRALPPAQIYTNLSNISKCACDPTKENPCGPESQCLNRSLLMECHADFCLAKDLCQNQKFQKRQYVPTKIFKTIDRGWGLMTTRDVKKGEFIIEYVGEIITHEEYRKRSGEMQINGDSNYYFLYLDARRMIDAGPMGNYSRFINHSCEPNCEMRKWSVNGDARIGIFAVVNISAGEELTFNYQSDKYEFEQKCLCSSSSCRGFIGRTTDYHLKVAGMASKPSTSMASKPSTSMASKPSTSMASKPSTSMASKPSTSMASKPSTSMASKPSTSKAIPAKIPFSVTEAQSGKRKTVNPNLYKNFLISSCSSASSSSTSDSSSTSSSCNSSDYTSDSHSDSSPTSSSTTNVSSSTTSGSSSSTGTSSSTPSTSGYSDSSTPSTSGSSQEFASQCFMFSAQERGQRVNSLERCSTCIRRSTEQSVVCSVNGCLSQYHLSCIKLSEVPKGNWVCPNHSICCCVRNPNTYCFWCLLGSCTKCVDRSFPRRWVLPPLLAFASELCCQCFKYIESFSRPISLQHLFEHDLEFEMSDDDDDVDVVEILPGASRNAMSPLHRLRNAMTSRRNYFLRATRFNFWRHKPGFMDNIIWSDEAEFELNGTVHRHNCVYWAKENPHITVEKTVNFLGVYVWCGFVMQGTHWAFPL
ncbi:Histone-lysine N-methyltransferase NSD2 like protein [Argiope bruennichi]|uniref:Histone-lysine N-methyltransferase NSD2 like protein n=1 Tax=Argiope bruennichi TaxID=94029 RepID=A0A8T0F579_ARGBR|nr:Histone-lysine N-methyltransferase NSD2 like protein [Argiope bruennichi]